MGGRRVAFLVGPVPTGARSSSADVEAIARRFAQSDMGFAVNVLDSRSDVAEQLEIFFESEPAELAGALLYACAPGIIDQDDLLLSFDPSQPETGDSFREVLTVLLEHIRGPILALLELSAPANGYEEGELPAVELADRARRVARFADRPVELMVAVSKRGSAGEGVEIGRTGEPSPFTRLLLTKIESVENVTARELYKVLSIDPGSIELAAFGYGAATIPSLQFVGASGGRSSSHDLLNQAVATHAAPLPDGGWGVELPRELANLPGVLSDQDASLASLPPSSLVAAAHVAAVSSTPKDAPVGGEIAAKSSPMPPDPPVETGPVSSRSVPPPSASDVDYLAAADAASVRADYQGAIEALRRALGSSQLDPEKKCAVYVRIAEAKEALGRRKEAISNLEKALDLVTGHMEGVIALELVRLHFEEGEFREAVLAQERLLRSTEEPTEKLEFLVRFGRMWLKQPNERMRGRQMLERAWEIDSSNLELCRLLRDLAEADGREEEAISLTLRMCELEPDQRKKAQRLVRLAGVLIDRGRDDEGIAHLRAALSVDPGELAALELLADTLSERQEWSELERLYREVLTSLPVYSPEIRPQVEFEIARRLGLLLRDHLEDLPQALIAFGISAKARPGDPSAQKLAIDVARDVEDHAKTIEHLVALSQIEHQEVRVFRLLFDTYMRIGATDRAVDAASVLVHRQAATDRERVVYLATKEEAPPRYTQTLNRDSWRWLGDLKSLGTPGRILAIASRPMASAVAKAAKRGSVGPAVDPTQSTVSAVRAFDWACRLLGVSSPDIVLNDSGDLGFVPGVRESGAPVMSVGGKALQGLGVGELSALAARHAVYTMPDFALLSACTSMDELTIAFVAVLRSVMSELPMPSALALRAELLLPRIEAELSREQREELRELALRFEAEGGRFELLRYVELAERAGMRAALLSVGDLPVTIKALTAMSNGPPDFRYPASVEQIESELIRFVVSDEHGDLRWALGRTIE